MNNDDRLDELTKQKTVTMIAPGVYFKETDLSQYIKTLNGEWLETDQFENALRQAQHKEIQKRNLRFKRLRRKLGGAK